MSLHAPSLHCIFASRKFGAPETHFICKGLSSLFVLGSQAGCQTAECILTSSSLPSHEAREGSYSNCMQIVRGVSLLPRPALKEEQVGFSFEVGPHAPRIIGGLVPSKQGVGVGWGWESLLCELHWPGARQREQR